MVRPKYPTNEKLKSGDPNSTFREDLYHRLNEFSLHILPLRERQEDLRTFANSFIDSSNQRLHKNIKGISEEVWGIFHKYYWPGNLRELKNIIRRAVLLCKEEIITPDQLPFELKSELKEGNLDSGKTYRNLMEDKEKENIINALKSCNQNKSQAARILGIDRKTLYNKLDKYGIE
ncbi:Response regulator of zinc sigma-54-dependent two-component system [Indibacter alkaliphilus LW1]|uniref:Response regulator of zinc sigma-54-dependent two-component system n=1 Tax=Indibacter alkaliphilus (strain CCUG 57479 / KCTC 22604 / LW1) TaxID=1189612 RepID=S2D8Z9_INDAL|nr:helix-turn-helix domain-containing protein [Indibacter alkaliphilus]EOZ95394.1 Response regulator of zinc sigma-54-dependent two-component system [Indibacter alkaliphilus LW1]